MNYTVLPPIVPNSARMTQRAPPLNNATDEVGRVESLMRCNDRQIPL